MALLLSLTPLTTLSPLRSPSLSVNAAPISKVALKCIDLQPKSFAVTKKKRSSCVVGASDGGDPVESGEPPSENAVVPVEQLPLESEEKERLLMENKARMKLARKLRLRRKRLVTKRKLRKKGRWPPSKMKKLKNV